MSSLQDGLSLEEEFYPTDAARVHRWLPWLRMLRAFRVSVGVRMLLVSLLGLLIWGVGDLGLQRLCAVMGVGIRPLESLDLSWHESISMLPRPELSSRLFWEPLLEPESVIARTVSILWPLRIVSNRAAFLLQSPKGLTEYLLQWALLLWTLTVVGTTGGILSRMAAIELSSSGATLSASVQLARKHFMNYLGAPLSTVVVFGGLWATLMIGGWLGRIPLIGEVLLGLFWCVSLIFGLLLALLVIGVAAGWPLMICGISVEDSDAFDGLSRAYTYVFNRPWYALFLVLFAVFYAALLLCFVEGLVQLAMALSLNASGLDLSDLSSRESVRPTLAWRNFLVLFWINFASSMPLVWGGSFFWSATTVIYILLRRREDGTPVTDVGGLSSLKTSDGPPLVGIPAAVQREKRAEEPLPS